MNDDRGIDRTTGPVALDDMPSDTATNAWDTGDTERLWRRRLDGNGGGQAIQLNGEPEAVPSVAAIAGHPLHPSVVPLPIGSFVGAWVADLAYARTGDPFWARAAHHLTQAGIATGLMAGSLGAMDFLGREQVRAHGSAWVHAGGNLTAVALAAGSLGLRGSRPGRGPQPAPLALSTAIVAILGVTGWLGGELSYRHRIGVTRS
jgi:uncharacterized membrane protein